MLHESDSYQMPLTVPEVGLQGTWTWPSKVTLLAGVVRVMKLQRCQPQLSLRRSQEGLEDLLHRINFLHSTGSFDTKEE